MRNLLLASAFLATATLARAENGVTTSVAFDDVPVLNAPLNGPAFIDPVFPAELDAQEEEIAQLDPSADLPLPDDGGQWVLKDDAFETVK